MPSNLTITFSRISTTKWGLNQHSPQCIILSLTVSGKSKHTDILSNKKILED
jgi:hypothetical protein